jgi:hypothetical protein
VEDQRLAAAIKTYGFINQNWVLFIKTLNPISIGKKSGVFHP